MESTRMYITPNNIIFKDNTRKDKDHFFCTVCGLTHTTYEDIDTSKKWDGACHDCYLTFIEARRKEWKAGWRPDKETLEEYIYKRHEIIFGQEKK